MRLAPAALLAAALLTSLPAMAGSPETGSQAANLGTVDPADERAALIIDSGRLVVMMDQSKAALDVVAPGAAHGDLVRARAQRAYAFQELVAAVLHYNLLAAKACRAGAAPARFCTGPYLPDWLTDPPGTDHSEADLRAMVEAAGHRLVPFWSEVCGRGRAASKDRHFCDLE